MSDIFCSFRNFANTIKQAEYEVCASKPPAHLNIDLAKSLSGMRGTDASGQTYGTLTGNNGEQRIVVEWTPEVREAKSRTLWKATMVRNAFFIGIAVSCLVLFPITWMFLTALSLVSKVVVVVSLAGALVADIVVCDLYKTKIAEQAVLQAQKAWQEKRYREVLTKEEGVPLRRRELCEEFFRQTLASDEAKAARIFANLFICKERRSYSSETVLFQLEMGRFADRQLEAEGAS